MVQRNKPEEADVRVHSVRPLSPASRPRRAAEPFLWLQRGHFCVTMQSIPNAETIGQQRVDTAFSQIRQKRLEVLLWGGDTTLPLKNRTQRLTRANTGDFCVWGLLVGW